LIVNNYTIKFFATEKREEKNYGKLNHEAASARKNQYYRSMWIRGSAGFMSILLEIGIMYFAIRMRGDGLISLGMIVLLQVYILRVIDFLRGIGQTLRHVFVAMSESSEILEIIDTPHEIQDNSSKRLKVTSGAISFQGVDFSYGKEAIFKDLNLDIKP